MNTAIITLVIISLLGVGCASSQKERYNEVMNDIGEYAEGYCPTLAAATWGIGSLVDMSLDPDETDDNFITHEVANIAEGVCRLLKDIAVSSED